jgi:sulfide-dependent adenosine diphosphate thiazole synthase
MPLDERIITRTILDRWHAKFRDSLDVHVCIVGGGPAGFVAGYFLATWGWRVSLFERKLSVGGGMWGGGMMLNEIVVQEEARTLLEQFGVPTEPSAPGYFSVDSVTAATTLASRACLAGLRVWNLMSVEDVLMRPDRVTGLVINWSAVELAGLHVDPLTIASRFTLDATGHACELVHVVERKVPGRLLTPSGRIEGEKSLWAEEAERLTLENTREVFPGVYVAGMAANAVFGGPRMGPIFGGMLLSGKKVAELIRDRLQAEA